jgi:hypothetical protein
MTAAKILLTCVIAAGLVGCASISPVGPTAKAAPSDLDRITYAITSCRGTCAAYTVFLAADGSAYFVGERNTRVSGKATVNGTPMLFARLKSHLATIRPTKASEAISNENCSAYSTDQQVVTITWGWGYDQSNTLSFDLGCHGPEHASTRDVLQEARRLLPIDHLIGKTTEF